MSSWTTKDIPDQSGRVAVVTGAHTGLGFETAKALAARGATVVLAVRDLDKGRSAASAITAVSSGADVALQHLALNSLASVHAAAQELKTKHDRIDLLINNACVMYPPKTVTVDGFESQFGTNHLGHFALTGLLFDRLVTTPGSRVVTVTSGAGHRASADIHFGDLQWERSYDRIGAYGQSKLANLLFTYELQRRFSGGQERSVARSGSACCAPIAAAAHPGGTGTLRAATDPGVRGGQFLGPDDPGQSRGHPEVLASSDQSRDVELEYRLWTVSEELTGVVYPTACRDGRQQSCPHLLEAG